MHRGCEKILRERTSFLLSVQEKQYVFVELPAIDFTVYVISTDINDTPS